MSQKNSVRAGQPDEISPTYFIISGSVKWVLVNKFCELTGYSKQAIDTKIDKGVWIEGVHWCKSPDNRRQINVQEYLKWVEQ